MRFNKLDLNLLVALDALLKERSITRAAERLSLSPSALSSSLARLREYFDDELLVPIGRKMQITPRAADLQEAVRDVLLRIDSTIAVRPAFEPHNSDRTFRIFASDYTQIVFAPHLMALASEAGCTARFEFVPQVAHPHRDLERGECDLLVIPTTLLSPHHPSEVLFSEDFVCLVARDGPFATGKLTLERYLGAGHIVMEPPGSTAESFERSALKRTGVEQQAGTPRRIAVTTYSFAAMPPLLVGTPFIATVHRRLAQLLVKAWPLVIKPSPVALGVMEQGVQWHRYRSQDPGLAWLRQLATDAARRMDAADDA